jgi:hypothetical protein
VVEGPKINKEKDADGSEMRAMSTPELAVSMVVSYPGRSLVSARPLLSVTPRELREML